MTVKISEMTEAAYPLSGEELIELVQGGNSRKALVSELSKSYSDSLVADVGMPSSDTWYDGPSVTLPAGKYLVNAHMTQIRNTTTAEHVYARISDGTNHYASTQMYHASAANTGVSLSLVAIIELEEETTIKLQGATSAGLAGSAMKAAMIANNSGNTATTITAVKVG